MSELAVISEAGRHFILNFMIKSGKNSFLVTRQGVVSLFIWCNPYEAGRFFIVYCQDLGEARGVFILWPQKIRQGS